MGIDWYRMSVKPDADRALLSRLVEQQAFAAQALYGWNSDAYTDWVRYHLVNALHEERYVNASRGLQAVLELPEWDDERRCAADIPDLDPCWRVYPITRYPIFPPLWRVRAHRTILPEELGPHLAQWKNWADDVGRGEHDDYLRELHLYATTDWLRYHWSALRGCAAASLGKSNNWTKKPALIEVRDEVLRLPEPQVYEVRIDPSQNPPERDALDARYQAVFVEVTRLLELNRAWNHHARSNWRVKYGPECYALTLDAFRAHASDPWLQEFFEWAGRCESLGFGLFFDY
jgi:hypothetical protein